MECKKCGETSLIERVKRTWLERIVYHNKKKFRCYMCKNVRFI